MKFTKKNRDTKLEKEINRVNDCMSELDPDSEEYTAMAANLSRLIEAQSKKKDRHISTDTLAIVAVSLLQTVLILRSEEFNVITSKAVGFIIKGRV